MHDDVAWACRVALYYPVALLGEDALEPDPGTWLVAFTCRAEAVLLGVCGDITETLPRHLLEQVVAPAGDTATGISARARDDAIRILTGEARNLPGVVGHARTMTFLTCQAAEGGQEQVVLLHRAMGEAAGATVGGAPWPGLPVLPVASPCAAFAP